jgi:hypothetical protein
MLERWPGMAHQQVKFPVVVRSSTTAVVEWGGAGYDRTRPPRSMGTLKKYS